MKLVRNETIETIEGIGAVRFETFNRQSFANRTHSQRFAFEVGGREYWGEVIRYFDRKAESDRVGYDVNLMTRNARTGTGQTIAWNAKADWRLALRMAFKAHLEQFLAAEEAEHRAAATPADVPAPAAAPIDPLATAPDDLTPTESVRVEAAAMGTRFLNVYFEGCAIHFEAEHNAASDLNGSGARRGATWALVEGVWKLWDSKGLADCEAAQAAGREPDPVRVVDITPTWAAVLPIMTAALEDGTPEGRRIAREELYRMARLADERNGLAARVAELEPVAIEANESAHCVPGMAGEALRGALRAAGWDCPEPVQLATSADAAVTIAVATPVDWQRVADLFTTGIEGGYSPWLNSISCNPGGPDLGERGPRYYVPEFWQGGGTYAAEFDSADDAEGDNTGRATIDAAALVRGLEIMARKEPAAFAEFIAENDDAGTGDVFLQCVLLGEVIYG